MPRHQTTPDEIADQNTSLTDDQAELDSQEATAEQIAEETTDQVAADKDAAEAAEAAEIDFITTSAFTLDASMTTVASPQRERNSKQKAMDAKLKAAHEHWVSVGRPGTWAKQVETKCVLTYFIEPDKSAALKKLITKGVNYLGVRARYGSSFTATENMVKRFNLPENYVGREVISFAVLDKRPRAANGSTTSEPTSESASE